MARYGRDVEKHVFTLMDGVPVKISEQFKPPRKVGLPAGYQQRLSAETVSEEYDFSLERSVLQKMGEWRKLRTAAIEHRKEKIKTQDTVKHSEKQNTPVKVTKGSDSKCGTSSSHSDSVSPIPNTVVTYTNNPPKNTNFNTDNNSILTPIQIPQPTLEPESSLINQFNFSDFEADTSSPFDNMELKTINEMEVLAHVLQPLSQSPESHKADVEKDIHKNGIIDYNGSRPLYDTPLQITGGSSTFPDKQIHIYDYCTENVGQRGFKFYPNQGWVVEDSSLGPVVSDSQTVPLEQLNINDSPQSSYPENEFSQSQPVPVQHITHTSINPVTQDANYSSELRNTTPVPMDNFPEYYCPTFPSPNQGAAQSQSKSVPDIVQELETELMCKEQDRRSGHSPRPNSFGSTGLENWKPWPDLDSPEHLRSCLKKPPPLCSATTTHSTLPNPFKELPPAIQKLALHISEMGFALPRVARACQAVGHDDKKVVEYLLQIQSLEDENHLGDRAERALRISGYDRAKAIAHLNAMEQLLGLGFEEQQVFDALVRFENDVDKALDYLIS